MRRKTTIETNAHLEKQPYWWSEPLDLRVEDDYKFAESTAVMVIIGLFMLAAVLIIGCAVLITDTRWM